MCLDIEHAIKVKLVNAVTNNPAEDGYDIVRKFIAKDENFRVLKNIRSHKSGEYCKDLIAKYYPYFPVWVFVEIVSFGRFRDFFEFCAIQYGEKRLKKEAYILKRVKSLRNAAGHSNCIINDLRLRHASRYPMENIVLRDLARCGVVSVGKIENIHDEPPELQNDRIKEIITLLYAHKTLIPSQSMRNHYKDSLGELIRGRMIQNLTYYEGNDSINNFFTILDKVFDTWYIDKQG